MSSISTAKLQPQGIEHIVSNEICVGCGICAGMFSDSIKMTVDKYGAYIPNVVSDMHDSLRTDSLKVCPFSGIGENEDVIAAKLFGHEQGIKHRPETGYFHSCYAGHVSDESRRLTATSGGIITWLAQQMLDKKLVDAVACVAPSQGKESLFEYKLVTNPEDMRSCVKSRYYPVEISKILNDIRRQSGSVLFIGLPCFIKGLHLAAQYDTELRKKIRWTIGLFCGHLKTRQFCHYLCRCCGVHEHDVSTVDFRKKVSGRAADQYAFEATFQTSEGIQKRDIAMRDVAGGTWSLNFFMLSACECCDDIMAETADISVGDAWLPEFVKDYRGTSLVICRNSAIEALLDEGRHNGDIQLNELPVENIIQSQAGGIRQRRDGLAYRLYLWSKAGIWRPQKRVQANRHAMSLFYCIIQRIRMKTARLSREKFLVCESVADVKKFLRFLLPWIAIHKYLYRFHNIFSAICRRLRIIKF